MDILAGGIKICKVVNRALLRLGDATQDRHLVVFGAFVAAPDQRVNKVPYFFDTGFVLYGPSRSSPKDFVGFAVVYGSYSGDLRRAEELSRRLRAFNTLRRRWS
jgi:Carbohydrate-selective porin, OprB family